MRILALNCFVDTPADGRHNEATNRGENAMNMNTVAFILMLASLAFVVAMPFLMAQ